ncbi:MAG: EVE domain-containing protein [Acidobacteriota bacterium]
MTQQYWLFKSEPDVYGIDDLAQDGTTYWDGVRNYQARNLMRDDMKEGDMVLYYHSRIKPMGVFGVARICRESYPDFTQFDESSKYYDPKATEDNPRWFMVDIEFVAKFDQPITLAELKADEALDGMKVTMKGQRLSVQPVEEQHFKHVCQLAGWEG